MVYIYSFSITLYLNEFLSFQSEDSILPKEELDFYFML
ncbi:hypothetical protein C1A50_5002 [Paenibacillus polymyxa]|nr:hypothetical protein C1A50_5002 [Paenibacillus polymyxa]